MPPQVICQGTRRAPYTTNLMRRVSEWKISETQDGATERTRSTRESESRETKDGLVLGHLGHTLPSIAMAIQHECREGVEREGTVGLGRRVGSTHAWESAPGGHGLESLWGLLGA